MLFIPQASKFQKEATIQRTGLMKSSSPCKYKLNPTRKR